MPTPKARKELIELFASVSSQEEAQLLLKDILTPAELDDIAERWQLIQALASGMTQRDVAEKCNVSISKITRGASALQHGNGGFCYFLKKLKKPTNKYCA